MNTSARDLYNRYAGAMASVVVRDLHGNEGIGSAFHIGEGVFVTARHVVENQEIIEVRTFSNTYIRLEGEAATQSLLTVDSGSEKYKAHLVSASKLLIERGPFFHPDADVDVAVFRVSNFDRLLPAVPLGDHLDDWLGLDDFVLTEVIVLGFPPVPFAHGPQLIAARGEVNSIVGLRGERHVHFIVSAMPRGGFSGGLVLTESGFALGVITKSLIMNSQPEQLGYMAVLSVEPIYVCLAENKLMPQSIATQWDDFWNEEHVSFVRLNETRCTEIPVASVTVYDDGVRRHIKLKCVDTDVAAAASQFINLALKGLPYLQTGDENDRLFNLENSASASEVFMQASKRILSFFEEQGYARSGTLQLEPDPTCPF